VNYHVAILNYMAMFGQCLRILNYVVDVGQHVRVLNLLTLPANICTNLPPSVRPLHLPSVPNPSVPPHIAYQQSSARKADSVDSSNAMTYHGGREEGNHFESSGR
jgi:hypothetical protein